MQVIVGAPNASDHRLMRILLSFLAVTAAIAIGACHGGDSSLTTPGNNYTDPSITNLASLPSCGTSTTLFTAMPLAASQIAGWVPLGNLNPSAHTFPTDHQYIYTHLVRHGESGTCSAVRAG